MPAAPPAPATPLARAPRARGSRRWLLAVQSLLRRGARLLVARPRLRLGLHVLLSVLGAAAIIWLQATQAFVAAPLFGLFFWCLVITRTFGAVPAWATVISAALLANYALLAPLGSLSLTGEAGELSVLFVLFAGTAVGMFASSRRDVVQQRRRLLHEQHIVREHAGLARALSQALSARDVFLAVAGHELRSPVAAALMQAQAQERRLAKQAAQTQQAKAWARQGQSLQRLVALVDGLLDVSRINSGQLILNLEEVDAARVVREISARYSELAVKAHCDLQVLAPPTVVGKFDRLRLEQVVANLLSNAFKYGAGGRVELTLEGQDNQAVLQVRDQGAGISAADKKRIFDCFERVTADKSVAGLGLGLWIVRQIVQAQQGAIEVDSEPGQGATFTVKLPLTPSARTS